MTHNIKHIFDQIHTEEALKENTITFLKKEIQKQSQIRSQTFSRRFIYVIASVAIMAFTGIFSYHFYVTPSAYIDVDVNPSIELTINQFNRVIDTHAYNSDGNTILKIADITHKDYREAIEILFDTMNQKGISGEESFISITLPRSDNKKENTILTNIETVIRQHHNTTKVDTLSVDSHVRDDAHELNLSPTKYLAIQALIEVDPTTTIDSCRGHTIREINQLTEEYSDNHHNPTVESDYDEDLSRPKMHRGRGRHHK